MYRAKAVDQNGTKRHVWGRETMGTSPGETVERPEIDRIRRWRFDELLRAGYTISDAAEVALRTEIDLHWAASLVRRGCPSATAVRIAL